MGKSPIRIASLAAVGLIATLGVVAAPAAGAHADGSQEAVTVIADHLNNPRGLSPAPDGGLYLAEAGAGGGTCVPGGPEGTTCLGLTGSLDLVSTDGVQRIITGLISASGPGGVGAEGPVSVSRGPDGTFFAQFGLSSHEVPPAGAIPADLRDAALAQFGHLWLVKRHGRAADVSDVGDQDWTWTSTRIDLAPKDFPDANPNAVPTCVTRGPDGALYVGELLGGFYTPEH